MINKNKVNGKRFSESVLDMCVTFVLSVAKLSFRSARIRKHNGVSIFDYPENHWSLIPFPDQKGTPFIADNLATVNRHEFLDQQHFIDAKNVAERRWGIPGEVRDISWRLHVMLWASGLNLKHANVNDALFVECGTGRGYMAAGICNYHRFNENSPPFYLVDSFTPYLVSSDGKQPSKVAPADFAYTGDVDDVRNYFSQYSKVKIVQGIIPEALAKLPNQSILFLHLDLNSADAEQAALQYLAERFITGTVILFDDYGGPGGEKQALIHEEFAKFHGKEFLSLPTGQALIIW